MLRSFLGIPLDEHRRSAMSRLRSDEPKCSSRCNRQDRESVTRKEIATPFGNIFVGSKLFDGLHVRNDLLFEVFGVSLFSFLKNML